MDTYRFVFTVEATSLHIPAPFPIFYALSLTRLFIVHRLHWRVRDNRRPPIWQNRHPTQRATEQNRGHLS